MRVTANKHGVRKTLGIPGTGLYSTSYRKYENKDAQAADNPDFLIKEEKTTDDATRKTNLYYHDVSRFILSFRTWNVVVKLIGIALFWAVTLMAMANFAGFIGALSLMFLIFSAFILFFGIVSPSIVRQPNRFSVIESAGNYFILSIVGMFITKIVTEMIG